MKSKMFWGGSKAEVKKQKLVEELEEKKIELEESIDQMLAKTGPFVPNHHAYSENKRWHVIEVDIDLNTLQAEVTMLESTYDNEEAAIRKMNHLLAEQSVKMRKGR